MMKKTAFKLAIACTTIAVAAVYSGPVPKAFAAQGAPATASAPASTEYKIGIVDMDEVIKNYVKLKSQVDALQSDRDKLQKEINTKTDALTAKMKAAENAPEADRERQRDEISSELRNLKADFQRMQGELDDKAAKLKFQTRQDIIKTIQQIGDAEHYHLVLEGDADGHSTVIYFATSIDITPQVIEKLNGAAPAAAPKK